LQIEVGEVLAFAAALEHLQHSHGGLTPTELSRRLSLSSGAVELLEKTAELTDEEREAVGRYLEAATEVFRRHARG
jgi:hypothetical protein